MIQIQEFDKKYGDSVIELILNIQQNEFGVPITIDDQKDLLDINVFYKKGNGNFWIAVLNGELVGTIALIDIGNREGCLRKMFVKQAFRGEKYRVAAQLLKILLDWGAANEIVAIYLGTTDVLKASHRFYEKNGWKLFPKEHLPKNFPVMEVDTSFYEYRVSPE